jgi:hypothetical protein
VIDLLKAGQFGKSSVRRCTAYACVLLVLLMVGVEAIHAHPDAPHAKASSPCAICISVHANAPAVTFHPLPTLSAVETVAMAFQAQGKGIVKEISLFIRPPPVL